MGSIFWQSTQVPAKNSINIKSFCSGTAVRTGVSLATGGTGVIVEGEIGFAGLQESVTRASINKRNLALKKILINVSLIFEKLISVYSVIARRVFFPTIAKHSVRKQSHASNYP
jgi:hypothetical protein